MLRVLYAESHIFIVMLSSVMLSYLKKHTNDNMMHTLSSVLINVRGFH